MVTVFYLDAFQLIGPPNRVNKYLSELFLSFALSINTTSEAQRNVRFKRFDAENFRARVFVRTRYPSALSAAARCAGEEFVRNSNSFKCILAISARKLTIENPINPIRY